MLGAGVFTTSGFAMGELGSPAYVLLAWLVGGALALCGAASYGMLVRLMPVSGGEYYFLSRAVHPLVGFIAGWVSLLAGFTGAIALAAITFEAYLMPAAAGNPLPPNVPATCAILVAALAHGLRIREGVLLQNLSVLLKLFLILGFIVYVLLNTDPGRWDGVRAWRDTGAPAFSLAAFSVTLMWVSFSYSGFNAPVYVASEITNPGRTAGRAMILATLLVTAIYLSLNAIFVLAPAPGVIADREDIAALAAGVLAGERVAGIMRGIIALALFTSVSAMIMVGPRVYARMAEDGFMPGFMRFKGEVPSAAIALQALLAVLVVWVTGLRELLSYLGFTLALSSALTVASLFVTGRKHIDDGSRSAAYPWAPLAYVVMTLLFAGLAATMNPAEMLAAVITILGAGVVYYAFHRGNRLAT